ncbi:MAG: hypothetical protein MR527_00240 [Prevotella sp.]|nr:hypothetical protein [Prevotella sp.]
MDINEQKNLATSYNLYSETTKELIQNLQGSIKYKFGIYLKSEEYKDKLMYEWFETEFDSLVSQGMEEEEAEVQAYDYAEELWNRTASSIQNVPPHHIWTIEKEIDDVVCKCILQINKNECLDIKLFTFDAKDSSLEEYKSLLNTIESTKSTIVLLIKNFAKAKGELFEWLRYDVKNGVAKNYQTIITTPLISDGQTQSLIGIGVLQTVLISE